VDGPDVVAGWRKVVRGRKRKEFGKRAVAASGVNRFGQARFIAKRLCGLGGGKAFARWLH